MANRNPTAEIVQPSEDVIIATAQTLGLTGEASDPDIGRMDGEQVEWLSNLDGSLGTGAELSVTGLGVGTHTITLRADDGEGGVATDTVGVTVVSDVSELPPPPDKLMAAPSLVSFVPAAAEISATVSIENENDANSIPWDAVASEPWVQLTATAGAGLSSAVGTTPGELTVTFNDTSLPEGRHQAMITIASTAAPDDPVTLAVEVQIGSRCPGDCNGDGEVSVNELIIGVRIALDTASVDECRAMDTNDLGEVSVSELVVAVRSLLNGCS